LEGLISNSWLDPKNFSNSEDLAYAYKTDWAFAKAASEIIEKVDKWSEEADYLLKKQRGEIKDKLRDALS